MTWAVTPFSGRAGLRNSESASQPGEGSFSSRVHWGGEGHSGVRCKDRVRAPHGLGRKDPSDRIGACGPALLPAGEEPRVREHQKGGGEAGPTGPCPTPLPLSSGPHIGREG